MGINTVSIGFKFCANVDDFHTMLFFSFQEDFRTDLEIWPNLPGGVMVKASACDSRGREFNSQPFRCQVKPWASCSCLCYQAV